MTAPALALDFGTSNSAAALLVEGKVHRLPIEAGADTLPTAVFLPSDGGPMRIGRAAEAALTGGEDGRYMRALKSVLGTSLFHEERRIAGRRGALAGIVTALLAEVKSRAEAAAGTRFSRVLSGRPVHFHSGDAARDAQAEADLRACYRAAGFDDVAFLAEPEAAALASGGDAPHAETRLIVDIGGGTSDFSVVRSGAAGVEIVASYGIRLGGTDFDQALSMARVMPLLGLGGQLRRTLGDGLLPMPRALYADLSTWAMIPFLYSRDTERAVADLLRHAVDPVPLERLAAVIEHRLGHDLAFAVERGKIAANGAEPGACIDLGIVEPGLSTPVTPGMLNAALAPAREKLRAAIYDTLVLARVPPAEIGAVVLVGGSSLMSLVAEEARAVCPAARIDRSDAFTAVVDGLALATAGQG
ncbi:Hsp70 family protein [Rhodovulum adriaticum]|uniref:Putative chaperone protein n=1 Tax=Rhodovulum adriaticum TaxID=35804 RepID=A0A4R2P0D4_RHOAD|nr:Hsp70 family protein [Rhodovulum adriaticum]MBK1634160.1 hsp70 family protein [Rhodovulum adriaticum]TCP27291.1 putative chaperone protein [Rhodovulum adriaticum]